MDDDAVVIVGDAKVQRIIDLAGREAEPQLPPTGP